MLLERYLTGESLSNCCIVEQIEEIVWTKRVIGGSVFLYSSLPAIYITVPQDCILMLHQRCFSI